MTDTIKPFREAVEKTELGKVMQEIGYGKVEIIFEKGVIKDVIPSPVFRAPKEVHYDLRKTNITVKY